MGAVAVHEHAHTTKLHIAVHDHKRIGTVLVEFIGPLQKHHTGVVAVGILNLRLNIGFAGLGGLLCNTQQSGHSHSRQGRYGQ